MTLCGVCFQGDYPWATETNWDDLNRDKKGGVFCIFASLEMCVCVCVFIKLHITTQSGPVILVILCHSH